jgi:hypothetical protein
MIFVTGDTHGAEDLRARLEGNKILEGLTKEDYLVILGDFGLVWGGDMEWEERWLKWLSDQEYTTLFVDGNHENFDLLYSYPVQDFMGGKASQVHDTVWWLRRGEVFTINGCKCFTFGGALSIDKHLRIPSTAGYKHLGASWWPQEIPSDAEFKHAVDTLEKNAWHVDYVFTHTCPERIRLRLPQLPINDYIPATMPYKGTDMVNDMLETIRGKLEFKHWYFGHFHMDLDIASPFGGKEKFTTLYWQVRRIDSCPEGYEG